MIRPSAGAICARTAILGLALATPIGVAAGVAGAAVLLRLAQGLAVGGEYGTGMIRVTLTAMPRRLHVLAAKAVVLTAGVLAAALIGVLGSFAAGRLMQEWILKKVTAPFWNLRANSWRLRSLPIWAGVLL